MDASGCSNCADSGAMVTYLLSTMAVNKQPANFWIPADGNGGWPTYYGKDTDNQYTITCELNTCEAASHQGRAPGGVQTQGGSTDHHLTFIDQNFGYEYDLWHVGGNVAAMSTMAPFTLTTTNPFTIATEWSGFTTTYGDGRAIGLGEGNDARIGNLAGRIR